MEFRNRAGNEPGSESCGGLCTGRVFGREWHLSTPRLHSGGVFMATAKRIMPGWKAHVPENGG